MTRRKGVDEVHSVSSKRSSTIKMCNFLQNFKIIAIKNFCGVFLFKSHIYQHILKIMEVKYYLIK